MVADDSGAERRDDISDLGDGGCIDRHVASLLSAKDPVLKYGELCFGSFQLWFDAQDWPAWWDDWELVSQDLAS